MATDSATARGAGSIWPTGLILLAGTLDFLANYLAAHYLVSVGTFLVPGGTFVFALSFVIYDALRRFYGFGAAVAAMALGFIASLFYSAAFGGGVGRIAVAGLLALICSGTTDLLIQTFTLRWPIWTYVTGSNAVSLAVDSIVFTLFAFAALPFAAQVHIAEGQYIVKMAMTILAIPLVYGTRRALTVKV